MKDFISSEAGGVAVEYSIIVMTVLLSIMAGATVLGLSTASLWGKIVIGFLSV